MQYDPRYDLLFLKYKVDKLETKLNKAIEIIIRLEEIIINEQCSERNQKECNSK